MRILRGVVPALVVVTLVTAACGGDPEVTAPPSATPSPTPTPTPAITELPFAAAAFPASGSACDAEGYAGRLGRVEAVDARTVRFELCAPDAAFLARLAHPVAGVLDATSFASLAPGPRCPPHARRHGTLRRGPLGAGRERPAGARRVGGHAGRRQPRHGRGLGRRRRRPDRGPRGRDDRRHRCAGARGARPDRDPPRARRHEPRGPRDRVPRVRRGAGVLGRRGPAGDRRVARPRRARHAPRFPPGRPSRRT